MTVGANFRWYAPDNDNCIRFQKKRNDRNLVLQRLAASRANAIFVSADRHAISPYREHIP